MQLSRSFEDDLAAAAMDDVEQAVREDDPIERAIERSHERLEAVADTNGYDVENVIDSLEGPEVQRNDDRITVEWSWTHEAAHFFAVGTPAHTIEGNPTLSFVWEDAPSGIVEEFGDGTEQNPRVFLSSVDVAGIERSDFPREGLRRLERELSG